MSANTTDQHRDTNQNMVGGSDAHKDKDPHAKPEAMVLGIGAWIVALGLEAVQQVLNVAASFFDMSSLRAEAAKIAQDRGQELSDSMITGLAATTLVISGLLGLAILGIIAYFVRKVATRGKNADSLQKLLSFFGGYLLFKALLITFTPPTGNLPVAYYAVSGVLQIVVGVAAVVGAILINRKESVEWVTGDNKNKDDNGKGGPGHNSHTAQQKEKEPEQKSLFGSLFGKDEKSKQDKDTSKK